ncbi:hypothetical protein OFS07_10185 [Brachyspira hyodysenteriae]|nr:hypothetical protein [Brachyspira hyodysenteriae]MDA0066630.1 hypothetical protein [Brachyspira hyodysenteriae]MDA0071719.1 hypothetical protein [Brachyspira hyodysenteriae]MDA0071800.1 hypothetical protein [Brachyspira hyodysenteriae]MDA0073476.1 hypothetical protein [Brachyspira hyodysenteriae]MDA0089677.1 hypothetical protein [Brachyspira hyodysenteriae]
MMMKRYHFNNMKEKELNKLLKNKEPEELTIEELKEIIPKVNDKIIKDNLERILQAKEFGCSLEDNNPFNDDNKSYEDLLKEQEKKKKKDVLIK